MKKNEDENIWIKLVLGKNERNIKIEMIEIWIMNLYFGMHLTAKYQSKLLFKDTVYAT